VIDNLNTVVGTVAARDKQLSSLVVSLQEFVSGLSADRNAIFDSLQTIDGLAASTTDLLTKARAPLAGDIQSLGDLSTNLADSGGVLQDFLQLTPTKLDLITRTAVNGSWFNFYLCAASGFVQLPGQPGMSIPASQLSSGAAGCS
jgi:phospholipid/cholesterol/gamma-HCH transport system substrate-binding protein